MLLGAYPRRGKLKRGFGIHRTGFSAHPFIFAGLHPAAIGISAARIAVYRDSVLVGFAPNNSTQKSTVRCLLGATRYRNRLSGACRSGACRVRCLVRCLPFPVLAFPVLALRCLPRPNATSRCRGKSIPALSFQSAFKNLANPVSNMVRGRCRLGLRRRRRFVSFPSPWASESLRSDPELEA